MAGAAAVAEAGEPVDVIAVSALGPAPVLVTGEGLAVSPALLFGLDRRAEEQRARLGVTHDHALPKLLWWAEHEPRARRAAPPRPSMPPASSSRASAASS